MIKIKSTGSEKKYYLFGIQVIKKNNKEQTLTEIINDNNIDTNGNGEVIEIIEK